MSVIDMFSLDGKVAYVTGAARGIGAALAEALAEAGADVAIVDIDEDAARATADRLAEATGRRTAAYRIDVTDPAQAQVLVDSVVADLGSLDIAFHNAGMAHNEPVEELTVEDWQRMMNLNLNAVFYGTQAAGRHMLANGGGAIVNTASMSGHIVNVPQPQAHYNTSKAGVIHLSRSAATEWAQRGVRVNTISPGYIGTELLQAPALKPLLEEWASLTPQRRVGTPEELKGIAVYLASDAASYTTGTDVVVDGGYTLV
ncbi:SDR family oxidoreductase [Georgenia sp. Z1491]|uniref:SDR family oxidoreductase n=1 Tax=Georgenia sp. Z1491 TaxID=3416707 RepID=UPI003CE96323